MLISVQCKGKGERATHGVGGTSDDVDDRNSVEERLASDDIPEWTGPFEMCHGTTSSNVLWFEVKLHQNFQVFRGLETLLCLLCGGVNLRFSVKTPIDQPG